MGTPPIFEPDATETINDEKVKVSHEEQIEDWKWWSARQMLIVKLNNTFKAWDVTAQRRKDEEKLKAEVTAENLEP